MADNVQLNSGSGGAVAATDDVGGVHFQKVKIDVGGDGVSAALGSANPLPVSLAAETTKVIGTVNIAGAQTVAAVTSITNAVTAVGAAAEDAAASGNPVLIGGRYDSSARTLETGDAGALALNASGHAMVQIAAGGIAGIADDAAFTAGTSELAPIGFFADEASTDSVDEGDIGAARITLDRKQIVTPYAHAAAGGATPYYNLDCDETEDEIKASAGKLFWLHAINLAATKRYLKFYNATAANVTVGTTTPVLSFPIPTMADTNGAGFTIPFGAMGVQFTTAITVAATTGFADNDTGAPGANEVIINLGYL